MNSTNAHLAKAKSTILRRVLVPSQFILAITAVTFLLPFQIPLSIQLIPLLLSTIVFGLPHGAIDHLVPNLVLNRKLSWRHLVLLLIGYALLVAAIMGLWWLAPEAGFLFFILLTWWHWGVGELHTMLAIHEMAFLNGRSLRIMTVLVRGGLPMIVPLIFFPDAYLLAASSIGALFGFDATTPIAWALTPGFRLNIALVFGSMVLALFGLSYRQLQHDNERQSWRIFVGETTLLAGFFAVVPSFLAIGIYFCLWHSVQHIARLALLDKMSAKSLGQGQLRVAYGRFMKQAMPLTVAAIVLLAGLYFIVPRQPDNTVSLIALYLALIAALTLPHTIVVSWMDSIQGVWSSTKLKMGSF